MSRNQKPHACSDCEAGSQLDLSVGRREFLKTTAAVGTVAAWPVWAEAIAAKPTGTPESLVKQLYDRLTEAQRKEVCFAWDHTDGQRGVLRTRVANNWHITKPVINSQFFTDDQRELITAIFEGMVQPDWHKKFYKQLDDDAGGFGEDQNIAIFGTPGGKDKFEFVMTGRHMTIRCDGNSAEHVAFGGPIFYGHAAEGFDEAADHKGNIFWHQALEANKIYGMLDGKQQKLALVPKLPREQAVGFRPKSELPGIPVTEMSADQKTQLQKVLTVLLEPYRQSDRDEVAQCLKAQGGLDACSLAFYEQGDLGNDKLWDCWRLEGPSFVWYFRGTPHVHVWVNVSADPSVKTNA